MFPTFVNHDRGRERQRQKIQREKEPSERERQGIQTERGGGRGVGGISLKALFFIAKNS